MRGFCCRVLLVRNTECVRAQGVELGELRPGWVPVFGKVVAGMPGPIVSLHVACSDQVNPPFQARNP